MAVIVKDRVQETTATVGTGALALAGAGAGSVSFSSVMVLGDICRYCISDPVANIWETGIGTYSAAATLARTAIDASSNAGGLISLAGNASTIVFIDFSAASILAIPSFSPVVPPMPGLVQTFDYVPARDGLALLKGGPGDAGYVANRTANPTRIWQPRYQPWGGDPKGGTDIFNGSYQWNADTEYSWTGDYTPFSIVNGNLRIRAARTSTLGLAAGQVPIEPVSGAAYTYMSGVLSSKNAFSQQGGYFEIIAKLPFATASWPAFWLMPVAETHPPEIDIIEYVSQSGSNTYHMAVISNGPVFNAHDTIVGIDLSRDFHKYAVNVTDTTVTFYIDDTATWTFDITAMPEFGQPFYILLALQVGSRAAGWVPAPDASTPDTLDMIVRSIRVWQRQGPAGINLSTYSYLDSLAVGGTVAAISTPSFGASGANVYTKVSDPDGMFAIAGGNLTLAQSVPATTKANHPLVLRATDSLGRTAQRSVPIGVVTGNPIQANYITSSDLTTSFWTKENVTASAANTLLETANSASHDIFATTPRTAATRTFNTWVECTPTLGRPWVFMQMAVDNGFANGARAWFDLANKVIGYTATNGSWSNCQPFLSVLPNGAIRVGYRVTTDATSTGLIWRLGLANGQDADFYAGTTTTGMKLENFWLYNVNAAAGGT